LPYYAARSGEVIAARVVDRRVVAVDAALVVVANVSGLRHVAAADPGRLAGRRPLDVFMCAPLRTER
jgi:hypothetical protein